ncbi:MAG TPA: hypothetical protein VF868_07885 [Bacteroidia bacterium]
MDKEKIEKIMASLDGIVQAKASPFLYSKILNRLSTAAAERVSARAVWIAAASFMLLFFLNFSMVIRLKAKTAQEGTTGLSGAFNLMNENSINYN